EVLSMVSDVENGRFSLPAQSGAKSKSQPAIGDAPTRLAKIGSGPRSRPTRALRLDPEPEDPIVLPTRGRGWLWILALVSLVAATYGGLRLAGIDPLASLSF